MRALGRRVVSRSGPGTIAAADRTSDYGVGSNKAPLTAYPARVGDWKAIGDLKFIEENALDVKNLDV